jgi:hypothetical protein
MDHLDMITLTRLPNHGWILESGSRVVVAPDDPDRVADAVRAIVAALSQPRPLEWCEVHRVRHMKPGQGDPERDPCAGGRCSDPAAHAEGGHDV